MADKRPIGEKLKPFREELIALCQKYEMEIVSVLSRGISSDEAQMHFIDINDEEMCKKYGLVKKAGDAPSLLVN